MGQGEGATVTNGADSLPQSGACSTCASLKSCQSNLPSLYSEGVKYPRVPGTHHSQPSLGTFFCQYCVSFFLPEGIRQRASEVVYT